MATGLVIVAAGSGTRFGGWKQLTPLAGRPLLLWTMEAFAGVDFAARIIVLPEAFLRGGQWADLQAQSEEALRFTAVAGGAERALSVGAGLRALPEEADLAAIHDGARPFPPLEALRQAIALLQETPALFAAVVSAPVTDTIKRVGPGDIITATDDRSQLRRAETPQVVRRAPFLEALRRPGADQARDDGEVLERAGHPTACVVHTGWNLKVTHREDVALAEALLRQRIGQGT